MSRDHFVPQFYLRHFEVPQSGKQEKHEVYQHDIWNPAMTMKRSIRSVLKEQNLFTFIMPEGTVDRSLEEWFSQVESKTGPVLKKIVAAKIGQQTITDDEWIALFTFMRIQWLRSNHDKIRSQVDNLNGLDQFNKDYVYSALMGTTGGGTVPENPPFEHFLGKKIRILVGIDQLKRSFITSDTPVTILDGIGIAHDHCVILFPVGSKRLLVASTEKYLPDNNLLNENIEEFVTMVNSLVAKSASRYLIAGDVGELALATSSNTCRTYESFRVRRKEGLSGS